MAPVLRPRKRKVNMAAKNKRVKRKRRRRTAAERWTRRFNRHVGSFQFHRHVRGFPFQKQDIRRDLAKLKKTEELTQKGGAIFGVMLGLARALVPVILRVGARSAVFFARAAMKEVPKEILAASLELALKSAHNAKGRQGRVKVKDLGDGDKVYYTGAEPDEYWLWRRKRTLRRDRAFKKKKMTTELVKQKKKDQAVHLQRSMNAAKRRRMVL